MTNEFKGRQSTLPQVILITREEAALAEKGDVGCAKLIAARFEAARTRAHETYTKRLRDIAKAEDAAMAELEAYTKALAARELASKDPAARKRQPLAITHRWGDQREAHFVPPTVTSEILEARIDEICGCGGKHDCDCVSVFNQAKRELWGEHNGLPRATPESRRKEALCG